MTPAGYSGTPLPRKLGITGASRIALLNPPSDYLALLGTLPEGVVFVKTPSRTTTMVHLFATDRARLARQLASLRKKLRDDAAVWVSWPKKASGELRGHQGVRGERDLVGAQAGGAEGTAGGATLS